MMGINACVAQLSLIVELWHFLVLHSLMYVLNIVYVLNLSETTWVIPKYNMVVLHDIVVMYTQVYNIVVHCVRIVIHCHV